MSTDLPAELLTASSGSAGDVVHSHNQHGRYVKPRVTPADPGTALQVSVRSHLATCCLAWNNTLSQDERDTWERYALAVRLSGRLGRRNHVGGVAMYVRSNVPRLQAAEVTLPRVDVAPALHDLASPFPLERVVLNPIDDTFHPIFVDTDAWVTESGAALLFYTSAPQPLTRNFWNGPYRYTAPLLGSDPTLSSPATIPLLQPATVSQRVFVRIRLTRADGRLSHSAFFPADPAPQVAPLFVDADPTFGPGSRMKLAVNFDTYIRRQSHLPGSWLWRYSGYLFYPFSAVTVGSSVVLTANPGPVNPGPDIVQYLTATPDVYGLLTGIAVANFTSNW